MPVEKMHWTDIKTAKSAAIKIEQLKKIAAEYAQKSESAFNFAKRPQLSLKTAQEFWAKGQGHAAYVTRQYEIMNILADKFNLPRP